MEHILGVEVVMWNVLINEKEQQVQSLSKMQFQLT